jgi:hypothetical protein
MGSKTAGNPAAPKGDREKDSDTEEPVSIGAVIRADVEERFADVHKQLEIQLTRIAQMQAQMDHLLKIVTELKKEKD